MEEAPSFQDTHIHPGKPKRGPGSWEKVCAAFPVAHGGCGSGCTLGNCVCKSASYMGNYTPVLARGAQAAQSTPLPHPLVLLLRSDSSTEAEGMKKQHSSRLPASFVFKG